MTIKLKAGERLDDLQLKGYKIIQNQEKFCFGMDAVLLSDYVRAKPSDCILDLGTGTGIIPLLLAGKEKGKCIKGLEIQEESADMASRSAVYNKLEERIQIVTGDIKNAAETFGTAAFDIVTVNPPYMIDSHGFQSEMTAKAIARQEILCNLEDVVKNASAVLKEKGKFFMVHRPFRLAEIIVMMKKYRLEPKRMRFVYPYVNREPNMVLIEGLKGGNERITVEAPLIVYEDKNVYTKEILQIYGKV